MKNKVILTWAILSWNEKLTNINVRKKDILKKIFFVASLFLSFGLNAQNNTIVLNQNSIEVKFLDTEQYVYYLKKHPQIERGLYTDDGGTKYLVLSETNSLFELLKNSQLDGLINAKEVNEKIVYVTTSVTSNFNSKTPYVIDYDNKGNYSIKE